MKMKYFKSLMVLILFFAVIINIQGCVSIPVYKSSVSFENPYARLNIIDIEPNKEESSGVLLRMNPPNLGIFKYNEENTLFARIKDKKGLKFDFNMIREDSYQPGSREDSHVIISETKFEKKGGKIATEIEVNSRGEIIRFIKGSHRSQIGRFEIKDWTRTPILPEGKVKIGDVWEWEEIMDARMKSFLIKDIAPEPYVIRATSILKGFASVDNVRCAVIETSAVQQKTQHVKVLFSRFDFTINSTIKDITYIDYAKGAVIAQITMTESRTQSEQTFLNDVGRGQSIAYLITDGE